MGFFHTKNIGFPDFSPLGTDLHCHVLPGMDDGASTMNESIRMFTEMARLGFTKIIATPHVISTLYPNTKDQILGQVSHLQEILEEGRRAEGQAGNKERHKAEGIGQKLVLRLKKERLKG